MTRSQKNKLVEKYMTMDIPEITDSQKEWIRRETAHYIFVDKDDAGNHICHCDSCGNDVELWKTKHRAKVICPSCGKEMEIFHTWRCKYDETIDWTAVPMVLNENTFMLRYVLTIRHNNKLTCLDELARMIYTFNHDDVLHFEKQDNGSWDCTIKDYFKEHGMFYQERKMCCLRPQPYKPTFVRELRKLKGMEHLPDGIENIDYSHMPMHWAIDWINERIDLYEKMCKAGLTELVGHDLEAHCNVYCGGRGAGIQYSENESSLVKMLSINKAQLRFLRDHQSLTVLDCMWQTNLSEDVLDLIYKAKLYMSEVRDIQDTKYSLKKTVNYIIKQKCTVSEWIHYLNIIRGLGYDLKDNSYVYPKSFKKADKRVSDEYIQKQEDLRKKANEERRMFLTKRDGMIAKISDALRENYRIREFFSGSNGLQVYVPESAEELLNAGRDLHNCIGSYADRIAQGKALVFFVRRIEDPTSPYIALEYCHGRIVQCRYDHNRSVDDPKVIKFTEALAASLREANILVA